MDSATVKKRGLHWGKYHPPSSPSCLLSGSILFKMSEKNFKKSDLIEGVLLSINLLYSTYYSVTLVTNEIIIGYQGMVIQFETMV